MLRWLTSFNCLSITVEVNIIQRYIKAIYGQILRVEQIKIPNPNLM